MRLIKENWLYIFILVETIMNFCCCQNEKQLMGIPLVITTEITEITKTTAISGGNISNEGGTRVNARGVCWNTNGTPTINDSKTVDGTGAGIFRSSLSGLKAKTNYFLRAYATSSEGTGYGKVTSFTTLEEEEEFSFRDDFNGTVLNENIWRIGGWKEHDGQLGRERVFIQDGILHIQLINDNGNILSSAIQTHPKFLYGKWEARLKITSVSGVLNSFYTIDWDDNVQTTRQEVDIEFLTYSFGENSGAAHFAVHASGLKSFNTNPDIKLDFNPSDDFHIWGLDITPEKIEWSVDGNSLLVYKYSEHEVKITEPYMLKLNTRSQPGWIQGPSAPGVLSTYFIDWIQFREHK